MNKPFLFVLVALSVPALRAQVSLGTSPSIHTTGSARVFVAPDQVKVDATVTTQGLTAQDASTQNATQTAAVLAALQTLLGAGADIKTVSYSVTPNYKYPPNGGNPTLTGFTANNTIEVTLSVVTTAGPVIDTATQAGATMVTGLRFALKDAEPARLQALKQATSTAKSHADAMASGVGLKVGTVVLLQEGSSVQPIITTLGAAPTSTTTPVEPGLIEVDATVTLEAQLTN